MPKLLPPPFRALKRSGFGDAFALTTLPEARTTYTTIRKPKGNDTCVQEGQSTSEFATLSQTNPYLGANQELPPANRVSP